MRRPLALACVVLPVALILGGCAGAAAPKPVATERTEAQICEDLGKAVKAFYKIANPGSTVTSVDLGNLPQPNGVKIPVPSCSFEMRPDPELVPGDVWTLENFYLSPKHGLVATITDSLVKAGYKPKAKNSNNYAVLRRHVYYSASILSFDGTDSQPYSKAAGGPVLDFTIGQS